MFVTSFLPLRFAVADFNACQNAIVQSIRVILKYHGRGEFCFEHIALPNGFGGPIGTISFDSQQDGAGAITGRQKYGPGSYGIRNGLRNVDAVPVAPWEVPQFPAGGSVMAG